MNTPEQRQDGKKPGYPTTHNKLFACGFAVGVLLLGAAAHELGKVLEEAERQERASAAPEVIETDFQPIPAPTYIKITAGE